MIAKILKKWGLIGTIAMIIATMFAVNAFAGHTDDLHQSKYYGAPGEIIKGQVTIFNPSNETKRIKVYPSDEEDEWVFIPKRDYTLGPLSRAVIRYDVRIPSDATKSCDHDIFIQEYFPSNTLSLKHRVQVFIAGDEDSLRGGAEEVNILYVTVTIMMIVAFAIGLALGGSFCIKGISKWLNGDKHHKKKVSKRGK